MIYSYTISTPTNTPESQKKATRLKLCKGIIHIVYIIFPPGPRGELHLTISHAAHQIFPTNAEENLALDAVTIQSPEHYPLEQPPYELVAHTWNLDDTNHHKVIIILGILEKKYIAPWLLSVAEKIRGLAGV